MMLRLSEQEGEINSPVFVAFRKAKSVCFVDERGIEDHSAVLRVGHGDIVACVPRNQFVKHVPALGRVACLSVQ
jgi:hypothetical protein|eukprot:COSAG02_NODE_250_length_27076_cov_24.440618_5_plen_74_part_00